MERELYYVPSIEEFHSGFEYEKEIFDTSFSDGKELHWIKEIFDTTDDNYGFQCDDKRVKYLDRSEIFSLGWEYGGATWNEDGVHCGEYDNPKCTNMYIHSYSAKEHKSRWCMEYCVDTKKLEIIDSDSKNKFIFSGTINNKSELKKLMKQLNIQ